MVANIFSFRLSAEWLHAYADYMEILQQLHPGKLFSVEASAELVPDGIGYEIASLGFGIIEGEAFTSATHTFTPQVQQAEGLAQLFHETYERLAPLHGYKTREESAVAWEQVPEKNKTLMIVVASEVLQRMQPVTKVEQLPGVVEEVEYTEQHAGWPRIILDSRCWTTTDGTIGAVAARTAMHHDPDAGEWKVYIGVWRNDEEIGTNEQRIAAHGHALREKEARGLFPHLDSAKYKGERNR